MNKLFIRKRAEAIIEKIDSQKAHGAAHLVRCAFITLYNTMGYFANFLAKSLLRLSARELKVPSHRCLMNFTTITYIHKL